MKPLRVARIIVFAKDMEDMSAFYGSVVARGASMGPVREFGNLHLCDGVDPEGNVFQLSNR